MAKKVKSVEVAKAAKRARWWAATKVVAATALVVATGVGVFAARQYAERTVLTPSTPPAVVIMNPPSWMNDQLRARMEQIATPVSEKSSLDASEVRKVAEILAAEPWVKKVNQVRRVYGKSPGDTLEIDCEFRAPVALVQDEGWFWMVDADGVKLPERFLKTELAKVALGDNITGMALRIVVGVHQPAPQAGELWRGDDLKAALDLAKIFHGKTYLDDIAMIDVSNVDPPSLDELHRKNEVVLHTKFNTQIRWGEPPNAGAFSVDVPAAQKLMTLEQMTQQFGRVDAGKPWIDIRFDRVLYEEPKVQSATTNSP